ncbi:hypothetical protein Bpfe_014587 [Biomphalaria pfeifferi]|uniref:Uncharacterized protein n=1 Tax=Biomphalaria pfeifferi TaxID=112525 RepID=A0AAD8BJT8_BIOPF|nr:hypothetical protein Bpfe_014587 [Biomphalaria pfeifferi]
MAKWSERSVIYRVTLLFNYFIFLVYGLAFAIPTWWGSGIFRGLWVECSGTDTSIMTDCNVNAFGSDNAWMDGVRGVWIGGMACYVLAVLHSLIENCCTKEGSRDYGVTGILTLLAGACGAAGVITVAVEVETNVVQGEYFWGFMLACITSGLALIMALVLLITCNIVSGDKTKARTADYVFNRTAAPYTQEFTNQGYTREDLPLSNGVTHHFTPNPNPNPYTMYPTAPYSTNSLQYQSNGKKYPGNGYDMSRPNQRHSLAESADLSNGYTPELLHAEQTLTRNLQGPNGAGLTRNDYQMNGSRPY